MLRSALTLHVPTVSVTHVLLCLYMLQVQHLQTDSDVDPRLFLLKVGMMFSALGSFIFNKNPGDELEIPGLSHFISCMVN